MAVKSAGTGRGPVPGRERAGKAAPPPTLGPRRGQGGRPAGRVNIGQVNAGQVNAALARYWRWFASLSDPARAQVTAPLLNKLRAVLLRPRQLLCGGPSTINLSAVLDHVGVLLVRIPKAGLGEETTRLVASLILAQAWLAATARAHRPQEERPDASILIDECHNFLNLPYRIEDLGRRDLRPFQSEEIVGQAMEARRDQVVVATNFGLVSPCGADPAPSTAVRPTSTPLSRAPSSASAPTGSTCTTSTGSTRTPHREHPRRTGRAGHQGQDPATSGCPKPRPTRSAA